MSKHTPANSEFMAIAPDLMKFLVKLVDEIEEPDLLWHADHAAEHADDLAERYTDGMENDTSWTFPVLCYRQIPDRRMKITLSQGEDRIMRWEWVPIADGADHD